MSCTLKKEDLRITKTYKALLNAICTLLNKRKFEKITVHDLCEEALISRVTFYTHFNDKYDLLRYWLSILRNDFLDDMHNQKDTLASINQFIFRNSQLITNLFTGANSEVLEVLHDFIYYLINIVFLKKSNDKLSHNQVFLLNFCVGGILNLLKLQVRDKFPPESQIVSEYLFKMLENIVEWDTSQEEFSGNNKIRADKK